MERHRTVGFVKIFGEGKKNKVTKLYSLPMTVQFTDTFWFKLLVTNMKIKYPHYSSNYHLWISKKDDNIQQHESKLSMYQNIQK